MQSAERGGPGRWAGGAAAQVELLQRLVDEIAHSLSNALAPVLLTAGLLRPKLKAVEDLDLVDNLESAARRGMEHAETLRSAARSQGAEPTVLDPRLLLKGVERFARERVPRSLHVVTSYPEVLAPACFEPVELLQLLIALSLTTLDSLDSAGTLVLCARVEPSAPAHPEAPGGRCVGIAVAGVESGSELGDWEGLFDLPVVDGGSGLGGGLKLAATRAIVHDQGGRAELRGLPGRVTAVVIRLLVWEPEARAGVGGGDPPQQTAGGEEPSRGKPRPGLGERGIG